MTEQTEKVNIVSPKEENRYSEKEILTAWNEVGRKHNGLTFSWLLEELRANKK
jgi:hypothetical protein